MKQHPVNHRRIPSPVTPVDWFRRIPNGGTFFVDQERADQERADQERADRRRFPR